MPIRLPNLASALTLSSLLSFAVAGHAQQDWQKTYSVSGPAALSVETADSSIDLRSCGDCHEIRIQAHGDDLSRYILDEHQQGAHVFFSLKQKPGLNWHLGWNNHRGVHVTVETPSTLDLDAKTADGSLSLANISGNATLHSSDGSVSVDNFNGALHLSSADGNILVHGAAGSLDARTADGSAKVDGKFTSIQLHTSDGSLDLALADGSHLTSASSVETSDGQVAIRLPHDLSADVDVSTSDGRIDCKLPLTVDHFDTRESSHNHLHGRLNAGGVLLSVHSSDGSVSLHTS